MAFRRSATRRAARLVAAALLVIGAILLTACETPDADDTRSATAGLPNLTQELEARKWRLVWRDSSIATRVTRRVTLRFEDGEVSGQGPCRPYRGGFETDLDSWTVTITDLSTDSTDGAEESEEASCPPRAARAEREYLRALGQVRDVELSDGYFDLVLESSTGDRLSFEAYDTYR